ncbi:MAG: ATP-binding cassette domain-containing protein [Candidatus Didemnitutus sp.]|nr:ATP-binding cassette domain-containing protein [Candidatus Didemnitutus sp.]
MPVSAPLLFDFRQLTVYRGERRALHGLDLQLRAGEHLAILGPNGCGKSTLIKTLTRELYPVTDTPGYRFRLLGEEFADITDFRKTLGVVALDQLLRLSAEVTERTVTGLELVLSGFFDSIGLWPHMHPTVSQSRRARSVLRFLGIAHLAQRSLREMSSGEQRRCFIGRAIVHDPAAVLFDEPTTSLDPAAVIEFRRVLRALCRRRKSVVLVTHNVADLVPEIDRVLLMRAGRIVADGPPRRVLSSASLSRLFGQPLRLVRTRGHYDLISR